MHQTLSQEQALKAAANERAFVAIRNLQAVLDGGSSSSRVQHVLSPMNSVPQFGLPSASFPSSSAFAAPSRLPMPSVQGGPSASASHGGGDRGGGDGHGDGGDDGGSHDGGEKKDDKGRKGSKRGSGRTRMGGNPPDDDGDDDESSSDDSNPSSRKVKVNKKMLEKLLKDHLRNPRLKKQIKFPFCHCQRRQAFAIGGST
jgi:hypothetical protein